MPRRGYALADVFRAEGDRLVCRAWIFRGSERVLAAGIIALGVWAFLSMAPSLATRQVRQACGLAALLLLVAGIALLRSYRLEIDPTRHRLSLSCRDGCEAYGLGEVRWSVGVWKHAGPDTPDLWVHALVLELPDGEQIRVFTSIDADALRAVLAELNGWVAGIRPTRRAP